MQALVMKTWNFSNKNTHHKDSEGYHSKGYTSYGKNEQIHENISRMFSDKEHQRHGDEGDYYSNHDAGHKVNNSSLKIFEVTFIDDC